jgi:hypothetical protein
MVQLPITATLFLAYRCEEGKVISGKEGNEESRFVKGDLEGFSNRPKRF